MRALIPLCFLMACDAAPEPEAAPAPAPVVAPTAPSAPPPRPAPVDPADQVVGKPAAAIEVSRWVQGSASLDEGEATLLVFFEAWCPHCRNELPHSQEVSQTLGADGLVVVGLTQRSKGVTEEQLDALLDEKGVDFPVGEISAELARAYAVRGIPAAALVKDGVVVWRGHPGRLTEEELRQQLQ